MIEKKHGIILKKIDEQFNEVRDRFYKFCSDNGIKLPNEEEQEIDE